MTPRFPVGARVIRFGTEKQGYTAIATGTVIAYRKDGEKKGTGESRAKILDDGATKTRWVVLSQLEGEHFLDDAGPPVPKLLYCPSRRVSA